jgi:broad specificity phosphatase PhoE
VHSVTVYYVRHGENEANLTRELSYRAVDHPLTERGVEQARRLAAFLAGSPPLSAPVYSSPLRRAVQTAEIVADRLGLEVRVVEHFRELDVGRLDGRRDTEAWASYESVLAAWRSGRREAAFPGGEDHRELVARVRHGLTQVVRTNGSAWSGRDPVLVVAHGGIIRAALTGLIPQAATPVADMENCAITELSLRLPTAGLPGDGLPADELTGSMVCWSQSPDLAALRPGTGRRRAGPVASSRPPLRPVPIQHGAVRWDG